MRLQERFVQFWFPSRLAQFRGTGNKVLEGREITEAVENRREKCKGDRMAISFARMFLYPGAVALASLEC
jgi:hypothetical protein